LEAALLLPAPGAARALLDLAERTFGDAAPWPPAAAAAVRRRIAEAEAGGAVPETVPPG
jgi:hypothetical protein